MRALLLLYLLLLGLGHLLWPWLRQLDLVGLPGDIVLALQGRQLHLLFTSALIPTVVLAAVWRLLER